MNIPAPSGKTQGIGMQDQSAGNAFRSATRWLAFALMGIGHAGAIMAVISTAGVIPQAGAAGAEYDYTGGNFTTFSCDGILTPSCTQPERQCATLSSMIKVPHSHQAKATRATLASNSRSSIDPAGGLMK